MIKLIQDHYELYLALACVLLFILASLVNFAVCVGLVPTKGMALPFLSYGGSSLLSISLLFGILMRLEQKWSAQPINVLW